MVDPKPRRLTTLPCVSRFLGGLPLLFGTTRGGGEEPSLSLTSKKDNTCTGKLDFFLLSFPLLLRHLSVSVSVAFPPAFLVLVGGLWHA